MKTIFLGDIHGRKIWEDILEKEVFERVVFVGDYFDSRDDINPNEILCNFKNIVNYKEENPDRVTLLLGNHDYHYLRGVSDRYSGYNDLKAIDYQEALEEALNKTLIQIAYKDNNLLVTHAGVTEKWCDNNSIERDNNIDKSINDLFLKNRLAFGFTPGNRHNPYGDEICQSPLWVRPYSLMLNQAPYQQVVGHTQQEKIIKGNNVYFIDTFGHSREYLTLDNKIFTIKK